MRPDVVTFWHGPLDGLRLTCLRSQVAAGHKVTVYSFDPLPGLPEGGGNAGAGALVPRLRSKAAAGHKVTVYSFDPLPGLPEGVGNAEAEAILPHSFSERLGAPPPQGGGGGRAPFQ